MTDLKPVEKVRELYEANDPSKAHGALDEMLETCDGPTSALVIVYEVGFKPRMRYFGRTLSRTEMMGVLTSLLIDKA